ncbi:MAG: hypothetical protein KGR98_07910, partial [Verrucomicrobia bacterium]|nr:hypothetical protein [Verrucomicrobiota bacterium]
MSRQTTDPRAAFVPRVLPWLLGAAMFGVYAVTLNHWVSFASLPAATKIAGWEWLPEVSSPLLYLVTWPFRWLPAADVPLALNLFAAFCAAWALRLLARSAAILPHDRTQDEREREHNDFGFLTIRSAWLPPALAVIVCGLQLTFWEQATNFAGETFDLLIFAFIIWSLLEYRIDELEDRLWLSAAVYGAGMAENWAMMGFLPLYVAAIVWTRRLGFFEWRFLRRMMLCGLGGMSFYLLLPLVAALSGNHTVTFWQALKLNLVPQYRVLKTYGFCIVHPGAAAEFLSLVLAYLLPLLMMAIRWPAAFGDTSRHGRALATFLFHLMHAAFLALLVWMAFDPAFSPRHLGGGVPLLTFYYLGALGIAYYSGYFLLLFGKKPAPARPEGRASWPALLNRAVVACVWLLAVAAGAGLVYRNGRHIQSENGAALRHYAELTARNLPRTGGYLLSDDPERLGLAEFALVDSGRLKNFVPLQSQSLVVPAYHRYLHGKYPLKWPNVVQTGQTNLLNPLGLIGMLALLSRTNDIFYLHPSYGYYFEEFYMEPHGLVYQLKTLPADTLLPPKPDQNLI